MSSLTKINPPTLSTSDSLSLNNKRPCPFSQGTIEAPAIRTNSINSVDTLVDDLIVSVAIPSLKRASSHTIQSDTPSSSFKRSATEPVSITTETLNKIKETSQKNIQKMINNSDKAYRQHIAKTTENPSIFHRAQPITNQKNLPPIHIKCKVAEKQGIRTTMEDASFFQKIKGGYVAGVCDGHGGAGVAKMVSEEFPKMFSTALTNTNDDVYESMNITFKRVNDLAIGQKSFKTVGATVVASFITDEGTIYTSTIGDSEAFLYRKDANRKTRVTPLSYVRDWGTEEEAKRAELLAPSIEDKDARSRWAGYKNPQMLRVKSQTGLSLNISNSIGDLTYKEVSREPNITLDQIDKKATVGFFCDGITGFVSQPEIAALLKLSKGEDNPAEKIANYALNPKYSTDNVTAMILDISRKK